MNTSFFIIHPVSMYPVVLSIVWGVTDALTTSSLQSITKDGLRYHWITGGVYVTVCPPGASRYCNFIYDINLLRPKCRNIFKYCVPIYRLDNNHI